MKIQSVIAMARAAVPAPWQLPPKREVQPEVLMTQPYDPEVEARFKAWRDAQLLTQEGRLNDD